MDNRNQQHAPIDEQKEDKGFDDSIERTDVYGLLRRNERGAKEIEDKVNDAKKEYKDSLIAMDQKYQGLVQNLQQKLDKQHEECVAFIVNQKAQVDGEFASVLQEMAAARD